MNSINLSSCLVHVLRKDRLPSLQIPSTLALVSYISSQETESYYSLNSIVSFGHTKQINSLEIVGIKFLNVLSASGMPRNVFGILAHLDLFKKPNTLRDAKKRLQQRFWSELYQGAKLFYLSGALNGRYPDREVHNLSRFISVMKNPRPLVWRSPHPYWLAGHFLDITPPTNIDEDAKCDRTWVFERDKISCRRGASSCAWSRRFECLDDRGTPSPLAYTIHGSNDCGKKTGKSGRRRLGEKEKLLFAPTSDVGGVLVDKDAMYIDIKTSNFDNDADQDENRGLGEQMVVGLQSERRLLGEADEGVRPFTGGSMLNKESINSKDAEDTGQKDRKVAREPEADDINYPEIEDEGLETDEENDEPGSLDQEISADLSGRTFKDRKDDATNGAVNAEIALADSDSDIGSVSSVKGREFDSKEENSEEDEEDTALRWKSNLGEHAKHLHSDLRRYRASDLARLLYEDSLTPEEASCKWRGESDTDIPNSSKINDEDDHFFQKLSESTSRFI